MRTASLLAVLQMRRHWRSTIPIVLLVAVVSSLVLWAAAAARRTDTAFERMLEGTEAWDVLVNPDSGIDTELTTRALAAMPMVEDVSRGEGVFAFHAALEPTIEALDEQPFMTWATDGGLGYRFARPVIEAGRMPAEDSTDEVFVDMETAEALDAAVGDELVLRAPSAAAMERLWSIESDEEVVDLLATPGMLPDHHLTISGVGWFPDSFALDGGFENPSVYITGALFEKMGRPHMGYGGWYVRLTDPVELDRFRQLVDEAVPQETIVFQTVDNVTDKAERGTRPPATALAIFTAVVGVIGLLLVGQAVARWTIGRARETDLLGALGASRRERFGSGVLVIGAATVLGVGVGAAASVLASPLAPIGPARRAEVEPGLRVDTSTLLTGTAVTIAALVLVAAWPLWRRAQSSHRSSTRRQRPIAVLRSTWAPLAVSTGARFALERDATRRSISAGASIAGACTAIVVAVAAMVLTASIDHVVDTPRLYGQDWSHTITFSNMDDIDPEDFDLQQVQAIVRETAGVNRASLVAGMEVDVDGRRTPAVSVATGSAPIAATIADGRSPEQIDEVALGRTTMQRLGVGIGDRVEMTTNALADEEVTVVGRAVLPAFGSYSGSDKTSLGEGVLVHGDAIDFFSAGTAIAAELDPTVEPSDVRDTLADQIDLPLTVHVEAASVPSEIVNLTALRSVPHGVAWALGLLVGIPLVHVLVVSGRARRHDLATLNALGAERRTIRWIRIWQSWTIVAAALVVGIPIGAVAGRWAWQVLADRFGTIPEPALYVEPLVALCGVVLLIAAIAALLTAGRSHHGATLRSLRAE